MSLDSGLLKLTRGCGLEFAPTRGPRAGCCWARGWVGACFALGYRLPWFDRHPSWGEFPHLTNPRLVVEESPTPSSPPL